MERADLFRIALAVKSARIQERYTISRFCDEHDVSKTFFYEILDGRGTSARITRAIDDFIKDNVGPFRGQLARVAA